MAKQTQSVQELFDKIAPNYDQMNNVISLGTHWQWRHKIQATEPIPVGSHVLDLCCGTGDWTIMHAQNVGKTGHVVGLDFSANMLKIADQKVRAAGVAKEVTLVEGDAMHTPYPDNSFDFVTIGFGLRNLPDKMAGLREMYRVLKPDGHVIILETSQPDSKLIIPAWRWYFTNVMPWLGKIVAHQKQEYEYLEETTQAFMSYDELVAALKVVGFRMVYFQRFNLGAAAAHYGTK